MHLKLHWWDSLQKRVLWICTDKIKLKAGLLSFYFSKILSLYQNTIFAFFLSLQKHFVWMNSLFLFFFFHWKMWCPCAVKIPVELIRAFFFAWAVDLPVRCKWALVAQENPAGIKHNKNVEVIGPWDRNITGSWVPKLGGHVLAAMWAE